MKRAKRFLVFCLSCVLALSTATLVPITANAEGTLPDVDASGGFRSNESSRIEVTEDLQTYSFRSTTTVAAGNYCTPCYIVYSGNGDELFVGRSDVWGWALGDFANKGINNLPEGFAFQTSNVPADDTAWATWLNANANGVDCKITMRKVGDYALVSLYNNGVTSIATIPASDTVQIALSGEKCILTNITSSVDHLDLAPAISQLPGNGGNDSGNNVPEGTFDLVDNSSGYRKSESPRMEVAEEIKTYTFTAMSNADTAGAVKNWYTPVFLYILRTASNFSRDVPMCTDGLLRIIPERIL